MKISTKQLKSMIKQVIKEQMDIRGRVTAAGSKAPSDQISIEKLEQILAGMKQKGQSTLSMPDAQKLVKQALAIPASPMAPGDVSKLPAPLAPKQPANVPAPPSSLPLKPAFIKELVKEAMDEVDLGLFGTATPTPEELKLAHKSYVQAYQSSQGFEQLASTMKDKDVANMARMFSDFVKKTLMTLIQKKKLMPKASK